jgi:hypothetical protein
LEILKLVFEPQELPDVLPRIEGLKKYEHSYNTLYGRKLETMPGALAFRGKSRGMILLMREVICDFRNGD